MGIFSKIRRTEEYLVKGERSVEFFAAAVKSLIEAVLEGVMVASRYLIFDALRLLMISTRMRTPTPCPRSFDPPPPAIQKPYPALQEA
jgi:hypothetical protein